MDDKAMEMYLRLLREIHENTDALKTIISNHETRLVVLEKGKGEDWKNQLLMLLAKALVIGLVALGSLAGAGSLLQKIMGV